MISKPEKQYLPAYQVSFIPLMLSDKVSNAFEHNRISHVISAQFFDNRNNKHRAFIPVCGENDHAFFCREAWSSSSRQKRKKMIHLQGWARKEAV